MSNSKLDAYDNYQWHEHLMKEKRKQPTWLSLNHPPSGPNQEGLGDDETLACVEKAYMPGYAGHLRGVQAEALFGRATQAHVGEIASFGDDKGSRVTGIRRGMGETRGCEVVAKPFALPHIRPKAGYKGHVPGIDVADFQTRATEFTNHQQRVSLPSVYERQHNGVLPKPPQQPQEQQEQQRRQQQRQQLDVPVSSKRSTTNPHRRSNNVKLQYQHKLRDMRNNPVLAS